MNFDDFEAAFVRENRKIKMLIALALLLSGLTTSLVLMGKSYLIHQGGTIFEERLLAQDVCLDGFLSVVKGKPIKALLTHDLFSMLVKEPFLFNVDKVLKVESLELGACKIILNADEKLKGFKIGLIESKTLPFYYQIQQIDEIPIQEEEL